jgi:hypothetical protein
MAENDASSGKKEASRRHQVDPDAPAHEGDSRSGAPPGYLEWNDLLARHFFSEEKAGKEVLLYANESLIEELGRPYGAALPEFVGAVLTGPPWVTTTGICKKALQTLERWRQRGLVYPPYIAYLALFVIAAGREGDFVPHAYYPRLWDLVGNPGETGRPPSFDAMIDLWDDLEKWSREDQHEKIGRFVARIRGGWWMVGLPLSQTLISEEERKRLPHLLTQRGLDPADLPSPEVILRILREDGGMVLQRRTLRLFESKDDGDRVIRDALAELIIEEFEEWDGGAATTDENEAEGVARQTRTTLRLCLRYDRLAEQITCHVRTKTAVPYPENGCDFVRKRDERIWLCTPRFNGWSDILRDADSDAPHPLNGAILDWTRGEQLLDDENQWIATLRAASTRVFSLGKDEGLPDWIEKQRLERNIPFLIAATGPDTVITREWGIQHCAEFQELNVSGLPDGWTLFSGRHARESCSGIDVLTISPSIRLLVRGGIRTGAGNTYLKAVPPRIVLENSSGSERVTLDGQELRADEGGQTYWIPENAPANQPLQVKVVTNGYECQRVIRLEEPPLPLRQDYVSFCRDSMGQASSDRLPRARGAVVNYPPSEHPPTYPLRVPLQLGGRLTLIGERPGQIVTGEGDELPWPPAWVIRRTGRKRAEAVFCGTKEQAVRPYSMLAPLSNRALVRQWKEVLWYRRKQIDPPSLGILRDRWREYVEVARNVR